MDRLNGSMLHVQRPTAYTNVMAKQKQTIFRVIWQHMMRHPRLSALAIFLSIAGTILSLVAPIYYKNFFDTATLFPAGAESYQAILSILVSILLVRFAAWFAHQAEQFLVSNYQPKIMADLERSALHHLLGHSYQFFSNTFAGSLVRKVHRLSHAFEDLEDLIRGNILPLVLTTLGTLGILYVRNRQIALIVLIGAFVFILANYAVARWKLKYDEAKARADSEAGGALSDILTNTINIQLFSSQAHEEAYFGTKNETLRKLRTFTWSLGSAAGAVQAAIIIGIEIWILYTAAGLWAKGLFTVGDFALLQGYLFTLFGKLSGIHWVIRRLYESKADAQEMVDILNTPHEIQDAKNAKPLRVKEGKVEGKHVWFWYQKDRPILQDLTMSIPAREKVALVGSSGAGKSTLIKILLRFYDIQKGKILIDGQDISKVTQDSLRDAIALVPQEPILFHRTLMENIRYGKRDATDEEVIEAAKKAHCHEFISSLPEGYQSFVGERGIKLSGGERQRIAIARAILKNAPILILDEATSSLDSESEALIQDALQTLMQNKTVIVIAHRLSTIRQMDRIIVLEKGHVIDHGTHEELLKENDLYRRLWTIQAGGFLPDV
jgi:ATP-binding cassette, subfamily B, bacterial